jgi:hypothetical protein
VIKIKLGLPNLCPSRTSDKQQIAGVLFEFSWECRLMSLPHVTAEFGSWASIADEARMHQGLVAALLGNPA